MDLVKVRGKRHSRRFSPIDKVHIIQRIKNGETKASISRALGVAESTLRGWCRNEEQLRSKCTSLGLNPDTSPIGAIVKQALSPRQRAEPKPAVDDGYVYDLPSTSQAANAKELLQNMHGMQFRYCPVCQDGFGHSKSSNCENVLKAALDSDKYLSVAELAKNLATNDDAEVEDNDQEACNPAATQPTPKIELIKLIFPNGLPSAPGQVDLENPEEQTELLACCKRFNCGIEILAQAAAAAIVNQSESTVEKAPLETSEERDESPPPVVASTSAQAAVATAAAAAATEKSVKASSASMPTIFRVPNFFPYKPVKRAHSEPCLSSRALSTTCPPEFLYERWPESPAKRPRLSQQFNTRTDS